MKGLSLRAIVVAAAMLATAVFAEVLRPTNYLADVAGKPDLEQLFPRQFGEWRLDTNMPVILPAPDVQAFLDTIYNQVLARTYVNASGQRVMLSVAYGGHQSNSTRAHRPEVCYPAQGFQITYQGAGSLDLSGRQLKVRELMSRAGGRSEPITYWMVVGDQIATTHMEQKLAEIGYRARGLIADGMLVRLSSIDGDMARGHRLQAKFAADLSEAVEPVTRERIFGGTHSQGEG